jgi:hypothetical protein
MPLDAAFSRQQRSFQLCVWRSPTVASEISPALWRRVLAGVTNGFGNIFHNSNGA